MIKNEEHVYIEWKSKLEVMMKEQYNITREVNLEKNEKFFKKIYYDCVKTNQIFYFSVITRWGKRISSLKELLWPFLRFGFLPAKVIELTEEYIQ